MGSVASTCVAVFTQLATSEIHSSAAAPHEGAAGVVRAAAEPSRVLVAVDRGCDPADPKTV